MIRRLLLAVAVAVGLLLVSPASAFAFGDCKEAPTPEVPGRGMAGVFGGAPDRLPPVEDPFAPGARTTIFQQYGYAGLRWDTYDLGCGPDVTRSPDAVIGTAMSNWGMNLPISLAALTSSVTEVAFEPTFLNVFDPMISNVSSVLYERLFSPWSPVILVLVGVLLLVRARRASLATSAAAVGWALVVLFLAVALFRWPVVAGHFADDTVTTTLGSVAGALNSQEEVSPAVAVSSSVHESILYRNWLAGEFGSAESSAARQYGPELFKAQALTWREAAILEADPDRGQEIIEDKKERFEEVAADIKEADPAAYEYLTGKQSDTRVGYALLSTVATFLALPFLLVSALLLLGSFLVVRLAVMLFPAFATLGLFPPARGLVIGIGRVVGAALVNAMVFGVGAAVTVLGIGLILDPDSRLPGWLALVLMPLFSFVMWFALKPFRRLTAMAGTRANPFGDATDSFGQQSRRLGRFARRMGTAAAASYSGNVAAAATAAKAGRGEGQDGTGPVPERAEARPVASPPMQPSTVVPVARHAARPGSSPAAALPGTPPGTPPGQPAEAEPGAPANGVPVRGRHALPVAPMVAGPPPHHPTGGGAAHPHARPAHAADPASASGPSHGSSAANHRVSALPEGFVPRPSEAAPPPAASEPMWVEGEEIHSIYRPERPGDRPGAGDDGA